VQTVASLLGGAQTLRRLVVIHTDGSEEVVEMTDSSTAGRFDIELIVNKLKDIGVNDVASVRF
jgi:hypothetical protein